VSSRGCNVAMAVRWFSLRLPSNSDSIGRYTQIGPSPSLSTASDQWTLDEPSVAPMLDNHQQTPAKNTGADDPLPRDPTPSDIGGTANAKLVVHPDYLIAWTIILRTLQTANSLILLNASCR